MSDNNDPDKKLSKVQHDEEFVHDEGLIDDSDLQTLHNQLMREQSEPTEQMSPMPLFMIFLCGLLLFWGGFYLSNYSASFRSDIFYSAWDPGAVVVEAPFDPLKRGKKLFAGKCQQCHQADGMGLPGVYPPINGSPWLTNSEERPVKLLLKGMSGPVTVLGKNYNGNMPNVADWKDRDIAAVLTYVRQNWDNDAGPISEELVTRLREETAGRTKPWTAEELLAEHPL